MPRTTKKGADVRVTDAGPVTGRQYLELQQKLRLKLASYQAFMGISIKEHYLITLKPDEPLGDPGLALHVRLLDEYPTLVEHTSSVLDLLNALKHLKLDYPDMTFPMWPGTALLALLLGRNGHTGTTWTQGRSVPPRKMLLLVHHLLKLLDMRDDPDQVVQHYCELVDTEAKARGIEDIFTTRRWPSR